MLKRFVVLAAIVAALAISLVGARFALAADPSRRMQGQESQSTQDAMPGMTDEQMAGMSHKATPTPSKQQMAGMSDEEMAGMGSEQTVSSSQSGSKDGGNHPTGVTESTRESRPLALVVGGFAVVNGAVLVGAAAMRRRGSHAGSSPRPSRSVK